MIQQAFALGLQRHPTLRCFSKEPQHLRIGPLNYKAPLAREKKKKKKSHVTAAVLVQFSTSA